MLRVDDTPGDAVEDTKVIRVGVDQFRTERQGRINVAGTSQSDEFG